jgi:mannose-1-phosphate guanylyltransferase/mannose-1-phosphate guanylyltransferase/mannose-6-phosphate isomerase
MIVPVILSGGSGTRLWPLSTPERPKQFLPLTGEASLFRQTLDRVMDRQVYAQPIVVANSAHEALCQAELQETGGGRLILEPIARNTAAAIVMAAAVVARTHGGDALMLIMPSDHLIADEASFHAAVELAAKAAATGCLVTFGVKPTHAETGFGYLESGDALPAVPGSFRVARFKEKPELADAQAMVADGRHFWNGGIFLFAANAFLSQARLLAPDIARLAEEAVAGASSVDVVYPDRQLLQDCPSVSVDYAVMEKSEQVAMVPLNAQWSDVGSWDALADLPAPAHDKGLITTLKSDNCYVRTDGIRLGLLGVDDLVVVASGDRVLIMRKGASQHIRQLAAEADAV